MMLTRLLSTGMLISTLMAPAASPFNATDVALVQACLNAMGFNGGPVDGIPGPQINQAANEYYRARFGPSFATVPIDTRATVLMLECQAFSGTREMATYSR